MKIQLKDIKSRLYHDELPEYLVERASKLYPTVRKLFTSYSIKDWIDGFKYDLGPEREIRIWEESVKMYLSRTKGKDVPPRLNKEIWKQILSEINEKYPIVIGPEIPFA